MKMSSNASQMMILQLNVDISVLLSFNPKSRKRLSGDESLKDDT